MGDLDGKVAIVTGGATLIGAKVLDAFVREGARVVSADINAEDGQRVCGEIGDAARFVETDITKDDQLDALVAATLDAFGGIDVLVNGRRRISTTISTRPARSGSPRST
jgi:NAD(P)-dependent dehydrogenase (short-subunit alcohol dehydrogenase family)